MVPQKMATPIKHMMVAIRDAYGMRVMHDLQQPPGSGEDDQRRRWVTIYLIFFIVIAVAWKIFSMYRCSSDGRASYCPNTDRSSSRIVSYSSGALWAGGGYCCRPWSELRLHQSSSPALCPPWDHESSLGGHSSLSTLYMIAYLYFSHAQNSTNDTCWMHFFQSLLFEWISFGSVVS